MANGIGCEFCILNMHYVNIHKNVGIALAIRNQWHKDLFCKTVCKKSYPLLYMLYAFDIV